MARQDLIDRFFGTPKALAEDFGGGESHTPVSTAATGSEGGGGGHHGLLTSAMEAQAAATAAEAHMAAAALHLEAAAALTTFDAALHVDAGIAKTVGSHGTADEMIAAAHEAGQAALQHAAQAHHQAKKALAEITG
jgi:hypothetical protein